MKEATKKEDRHEEMDCKAEGFVWKAGAKVRANRLFVVSGGVGKEHIRIPPGIEGEIEHVGGSIKDAEVKFKLLEIEPIEEKPARIGMAA